MHDMQLSQSTRRVAITAGRRGAGRSALSGQATMQIPHAVQRASIVTSTPVPALTAYTPWG